MRLHRFIQSVLVLFVLLMVPTFGYGQSAKAMSDPVKPAAEAAKPAVREELLTDEETRQLVEAMRAEDETNTKAAAAAAEARTAKAQREALVLSFYAEHGFKPSTGPRLYQTKESRLGITNAPRDHPGPGEQPPAAPAPKPKEGG